MCNKANTMPADALATLGASASAGMVLTPKGGIFCLQHQKSQQGESSIHPHPHPHPDTGNGLSRIQYHPEYHLKHCWLIVHWTLGNKFQWNLNKNTPIFIQENGFEQVICKMTAICFLPQNDKVQGKVNTGEPVCA